MKYSERLLYYFNHRHHAGRLDITEKNVQRVEVGNAQNKDLLVLFIQYDGSYIQQIRFQACGSAGIIAAGEYVSIWLEKKTREETTNIPDATYILEELGLPIKYIHIAHLIILAIQLWISASST